MRRWRKQDKKEEEAEEKGRKEEEDEDFTAFYIHHTPAYEHDHAVHVPAWKATLRAYQKTFNALPPASSWGTMGESGGCDFFFCISIFFLLCVPRTYMDS